MKKLISILVLLISQSIALAEVNIPQKHRVKNRAPGYCCWCCLETLGRNQGIKELEDLVNKRAKDPPYPHRHVDGHIEMVPNNLGTEEAVIQKLKELKVDFRISHSSYAHLKECCKNNGCVVFMKPNPIMPEAHAITLIEFTETTFKYIDPNDGCVWGGERSWFDFYWQGVGISIGK